MADMMKLFQMVIIIQLVYAFSISALIYSMPTESLNYVDSFSEITGQISLESTTTELQEGIDSSINIPLVEVGALVFYSGNILIDLLLNFFYAIPQMFGLLIYGFTRIFNIDNYIVNLFELFVSAIVTALYFIGILQLLTNIRSGRVI